MFNLPGNYEGAWTLRTSVSRRGVGLHSGEKAEVRLHPYEKPGFHVSWLGKKNSLITLNPKQVLPSQLCTTLQVGENRLSTVEHLLAALCGCGLSHVHIEVDGEEIPLLDGSALGWVEAISEAEIVPAPSPRQLPPRVKKPLILNRGNSVVTATPSEKFSVVGIIDFPYPAIGKQMFSVELSPKTFVEKIAPARTFGFKNQLEDLKKVGLIKGGSLKNALVCDGDLWLNPPLRFEDEPVRHKILDLIGDLALVGFPKAQILVYRGSHLLHTDLAAALLEECLSEIDSP